MVAAVVVIAVAGLVAVGVTVMGGDDGDDTSSSGCLSGLGGQVPQEECVVQGTDLERARAAGMDDSGGVNGALDWSIETGVGFDPLTSRLISSEPGDPSTATGYETADVDCWVGGIQSFAARGSFDAGRVASSEFGSSGEGEGEGELEVDGDVLVRRGTASDRSTGRTGLSTPAATLVAALDDQDVIGFTGLSSDDNGEQWTGVGLARGDDWDLVIAWAFADETQAEAREGDVRDALTDERSSVEELVGDDPVDSLERDGPTLWLRAPLVAEATSAWYRLQAALDPIFAISRD
jgi:hypothetical protein